jgi:phosphomannomutase
MKALVVFDLDGTLAESKSSIDAEMAMLLDRLLGIVKVAVISGGAWQQFEQQLLARLAQGESLNNLSLLPTSGTKFYQYKIGWTALYSEDFSEAERTKIKESLKRATESSRREVGKGWGETIEDRGSQITYSALGQQAPLDEKRRWDPDFTRRMKIKAVLDTLIPEFSVTLGGATSIDVTKHGVDKAYGIGKLRDILHIPIDQMIFIGDAVFPGGNDYPAKQAGALTIEVRDPHETKRVIEAIIACLADNRSVDFSCRPFATC